MKLQLCNSFMTSPPDIKPPSTPFKPPLKLNKKPSSTSKPPSSTSEPPLIKSFTPCPRSPLNLASKSHYTASPSLSNSSNQFSAVAATVTHCPFLPPSHQLQSQTKSSTPQTLLGPPAPRPIDTNPLPNDDLKTFVQPSNLDSLELSDPGLFTDKEIAYPAPIGANNLKAMWPFISILGQPAAALVYSDDEIKIQFGCKTAFAMFELHDHKLFDILLEKDAKRIFETKVFVFDPGGITLDAKRVLEIWSKNIKGIFNLEDKVVFEATAPVNYICLHCVKPSLRPLSMAMSTVSIQIFGDVPSAPLVRVMQVCLFKFHTLAYLMISIILISLLFILFLLTS